MKRSIFPKLLKRPFFAVFIVLIFSIRCSVEPPPTSFFALDLAQTEIRDSPNSDEESGSSNELPPGCNLNIQRIGFPGSKNFLAQDYTADSPSISEPIIISLPYGVMSRGILDFQPQDTSVRLFMGSDSFVADSPREWQETQSLRLENPSIENCSLTAELRIRLMAPVIDTGARLCYDYSPTPAPFPDSPSCSNAQALGQDAVWSDTPTSRDWMDKEQVGTNSGISRDRITGIVWRSCGRGLGSANDCATGTSINNSYESAKDYCEEDLNEFGGGAGYGGLKNWRLPTLFELASILNRARNNGDNGLVDPGPFPNSPGDNGTTSMGFWTISTYARDSDEAWRIYIQNNPHNDSRSFYQMQPRDKGSLRKVRCVSSALPPPKTYSRLDNNQILDNRTRLVWQKCIPGQTGSDCQFLDMTEATKSWADALKTCAQLDPAGTWRLPNTNELLSLFDYTLSSGRGLPAEFFPNVPTTNKYWSSTTNPDAPTHAFYLEADGILDSLLKTNTSEGFIRCVRTASNNE